jgi:hypothetical protein
VEDHVRSAAMLKLQKSLNAKIKARKRHRKNANRLGK